jgi:DUF4097 and DUF4098 domain-containing protein YvlB
MAPAVLTAAVLLPALALGSATARKTEKTFPARPGDTLTVRAEHGGDLLVTGSDKEEVHIVALDNKSNMVVTFETTDKGVSIVARAEDPNARMISTDLDIEVQVPRRYEMDLKTSGGDVDLENLEGELVASTMGGDISVRGAAGKADFQTMGGDIKVREGKILGRMRTMGGDIEVETSSEAIDAETMGGDITIRTSGNVRAATAGGDVEIHLTSVDADCEASTNGGDIRLVVPAGYSADFDVQAMDAASEIDGLELRREGGPYGNGNYSGKMGSGTHKVRLDTSAGEVEIATAPAN